MNSASVRAVTTLVLLTLAGLAIAGGQMRSGSAHASPALIVGDANCSGSADPIDAALILQFGAGLVPLLSCPQSADVNGDGTVNPLDAALILQYVAGFLPSLGAPPPATPTPTPHAYATPPGVISCYWTIRGSVVDCSGTGGSLHCVESGAPDFVCSVSGVDGTTDCNLEILSGQGVDATFDLHCFGTPNIADFTCRPWGSSTPMGATFTTDCSA